MLEAGVVAAAAAAAGLKTCQHRGGGPRGWKGLLGHAIGLCVQCSAQLAYTHRPLCADRAEREREREREREGEREREQREREQRDRERGPAS